MAGKCHAAAACPAARAALHRTDKGVASKGYMLGTGCPTLPDETLTPTSSRSSLTRSMTT